MGMTHNNAPRATIDFETRSACSLKACGTWRYSIDESTDILCLAFRLPYWEEGRTSLWHPQFKSLGIDESDNWDDIAELVDWIANGGLVEGHNVQFEVCIWSNILVPRYGWPSIALAQWRCSAAKAASYALPRGLDDAASALHLKIRKDEPGSKIMKKVRSPRKSLKKEREAWLKSGTTPPAILWHESLELFQGLWKYCRIDVLAEEAVSESLEDLNEHETELFLLDLVMNTRGFQLDQEAVETALRLVSHETDLLNRELSVVTNGYVDKATQRDNMKLWLASEGLELDDTQAATLDEVLTRPNLTVGARRAVELMRALGRSSTAKYQAMENWADPVDWRVRGGLLYHGASTGRWSGKGIQPHNFPKLSPKQLGQKDPTPEDIDKLWAALKTTERDNIITLYGGMMEALSAGLRGAIVAPPGKQLYVADFASIEARVLLWCAGDEEALDYFRQGKDIYLSMATDIYGYLCDSKATHKKERDLGKVAVLGCFAADTLVLTDRGWVAIADITKLDLLWDGADWVQHDGLAHQGVQETIQWNHIRVTAEHKVWTGTTWRSVASLGDPEASLCLQLALSSATLPSQGLSGVPEGVLSASASSASAGLSLPSTSRTSGPERPLAVLDARNASLHLFGQSNVGTLMSWLMTHIGAACWTELAQRISAATTRWHHGMRTMGNAVSRWSGRIRQQAAKSSWRIWSRWTDGTSRPWKSTASTTTAITRPEISASQPEANSASTRAVPVFDVVNAGPHKRFMVQTSAGPLLVSNCGYQMGGPKFHATCAKFGIDITEDFAQQVVDTYRKKFWRVKQLWYDQEAAAIAAVESRSPVQCGCVRWELRGKILFCVLPSGRRLSYIEPRVKSTMMPWGKEKQVLSYMGVDGYTRQWRRQPVYGGLLVENIVQAISRDLMGDGMLRAEATGVYRIVLSVHDELIAEADEGAGSVKEFEQLMSALPIWACGCPVEAEGWAGKRYRK